MSLKQEEEKLKKLQDETQVLKREQLKNLDIYTQKFRKLDKEYKSMKTSDSAPKSKAEWKQIIQQFLQKAGIKGSVSYGSGGMSGEYYKVTVSGEGTDIDKLYSNVVHPFNRKYGDNKDYVYIVVNKK